MFIEVQQLCSLIIFLLGEGGGGEHSTMPHSLEGTLVDALAS